MGQSWKKNRMCGNTTTTVKIILVKMRTQGSGICRDKLYVYLARQNVKNVTSMPGGDTITTTKKL